MDTIFLTGLTAECIIGIWDWERKVKQKVVIDLEMSTDIRKAAASDHHCAAPAREADQQENLRLHARGHRGLGWAG